MFDLWRGDLEKTDFRANPIHGDYSCFPPVLIFAGTGEVMDLSCRKFVKKAKEQGVDVTFYEKEMMHHCWPIFNPYDTLTEEHSLIVNALLNPKAEHVL